MVALILSHSNYLVKQAGTEKYITEQVRLLRQAGLDAIQVYPTQTYQLAGRRRSYYGVNFNQEAQGPRSARQLIDLIQRQRASIQVAFIQHLMFWQGRDFIAVADLLHRLGIPTIFFLHDFYTCCPGAFIPCYAEQGEVCFSPAREGSVLISCFARTYHKVLRDWRNTFREVLVYADQIVAPSEFVRSVFGNVFPNFASRVLVHGHLSLTPRPEPESRARAPGEKLRIAFLGWSTEHKGADAWNRVITSPQLRRHYDFYHLGSADEEHPGVKRVFYSYHNAGPMAAVRALEDNAIDLVFLWSMVPESYSYTMHEAMAAGLPVLTCRRSGNIAHVIRTSPHGLGKVFGNEFELIDFLADRRQVQELLALPRQKYTLHPNPYVGRFRPAILV